MYCYTHCQWKVVWPIGLFYVFTWIMTSIKYSWAMTSRQLTTWSRIPGRICCKIVEYIHSILWTFILQFITYYRLICCKINAFQLAQTHKVGTNENTQFSAFGFSLFAVTRVTLMLQTDPEFVHLGKIGKNKLNGFLHISFRSIIFMLDLLDEQ